MIKIKSSQFRNLEPTKVLIKNIYPSYRFGWVESERTFHTFIYFPDSCTADVVYSGDEGTKPQDGETKMHLRKQEWDDNAGKFKFTKVAPPNLEFFKLYKKVYDVELMLDTPVTIPVWDKEARQEVNYTTTGWETIRLTALPASRLQAIAQSMMLTKWIEKKDVTFKDRLTWETKTEKRLPFNWEDDILGEMIGKAFEFAVNGSGLDTKYSFREVPAFEEVEKKELDLSDVPFRQNQVKF